MSEVQQAADTVIIPVQRSRPGAVRGMPRTPRDWWFLGASALVGLWALFQNLYRIGTAPILADEPTYIIAAQRYLTGNLWAPRPRTAANYLGATPDNFEHPPLVKLLFGVAQWVDGAPHSLNAPRVVSALATLVAALVAAVWVGKAAGRWTGLLAGAVLTVLPEASSNSLGRFDRFAMLDPVASAFMVLSVVAAWVWAHRAGRAGWVWAVVTGVLIGCASASKENGFLGAVGPVLFAVGIAVQSRDGRMIAVRCAQAVLAAGVSLATFAGFYLPFPHPIARIRYLLDFQTSQSSGGHLIGFAGQVSPHPPWWANFWFAGHNYGSVLSVFLVAAALCAVVLRRDRIVGWCLAAFAVPVVFHCFIANVALGYYWVMWTPMVLILAALGGAEIIRRAARLAAARRAVPVAVAVLAGLAVLAVPAAEAVAASVNVARIKPIGVEYVPQLMRERGLSGDVVSAGLPAWYWNYYTPKTKVYYTATAPVPGTSLIVIGQPQCRQLIDQSVRALVAVNLGAGRAKEIYADAQIVAYQVTGALALPSPAQISAQPPGKLADHC